MNSMRPLIYWVEIFKDSVFLGSLTGNRPGDGPIVVCQIPKNIRKGAGHGSVWCGCLVSVARKGAWCGPLADYVTAPIRRSAWRETGSLSGGRLGGAVVAVVPNRRQGRPSHRLPIGWFWWQGRKRRRSGVPWVGLVWLTPKE